MGGTEGGPDAVITTKLFRPGPRQPTVARTRLHDLLRQGRTLSLTLVAAPAGWGKSTLVADWLQQDHVRAGWVSLDSGDDDPKLFWRYVLLAASQAGPAASHTPPAASHAWAASHTARAADHPGPAAFEAALRRLDAAGSDVQRDVLPTFINEIACSADPVVLVLDDYHVITSHQVHASLNALLDHSPPQLHLVLITRADPPLPLSRLRVRGELAEVRAEQLRFSLPEAVAFFSGRLGAQLTEQDVQRLLTRTEGWAAGLQLAALRLKDRADPAAFIERFTGADWHIVSYLGEEVLASQPPQVREFLLVTSVLNRMCAPLCDALTGRDDGAGLISEVNRAGLFLIPLDDERRWFRYHHLFGGLLRHELARTAPDQVAALHERAARWYARHGDPAEAIGHAIASGDPSLTRRLVTTHWRQYFNAGQPGTVRRWLDALPAELVAVDVSLSAARVWVALDTGRLAEVGAALDAAENSGPPDAHLMVLRALYRYKTGDVAGAARQLAEISPDSADPFVATVHRLVDGISSMWLGDADRARDLLAEAARRAETDGNRLAFIYAGGCQALLALSRHDLDLAGSLVSAAEATVAGTLSDAHFVAMFPALARARLAAERGEWAAAGRAAVAAVKLGRRGAGRVELAAALLTASAVLRTAPPATTRDLAGTPGADGAGASDPVAVVAEARRILRHCPDPGPVVMTWLAGEQRAEAARTHQEALIEPLTDRELAILRLLPAPTPQRELASALFVTPNTLKTHLRAIYRKLGAESRDEAVIRARERGLI